MPSYKKNPSPTQLYDLTVTINNPPGPFLVETGWVQYDIANPDCLPPADVVSGVQSTPNSTSLPIQLEKINETTYQGRVALDGLVDDDYFGHGTCRLKPVLSSVRFQASETDGATRFYASLYADDMEATPTRTAYYWQGDYPEQKGAKYPDHGQDRPENFKESIRDQLFSITISARKAQQ